jgi:hypothetical protein
MLCPVQFDPVRPPSEGDPDGASELSGIGGLRCWATSIVVFAVRDSAERARD